MNIRIFIIENQYTQFIKINGSLSNEYEVFPLPNLESFKSVMNNVRIALNKGYGLITSNDSYSFKRFKVLCKILGDFNPDIILIDHILIDSRNALTGIDLAKSMRKYGIDKPILFFSSSTLNKPEIANIKSSVSTCDWLPKGFDGKESMTREFLENQLHKRISSLLDQREYSSVKKLSEDFFITVRPITWFAKRDEILSKIQLLSKTNPNDHLIEFFEQWIASERRDKTTLISLFELLEKKNGAE